MLKRPSRVTLVSALVGAMIACAAVLPEEPELMPRATTENPVLHRAVKELGAAGERAAVAIAADLLTRALTALLQSAKALPQDPAAGASGGAGGSASPS
jgi:hypothetical protein